MTEHDGLVGEGVLEAKGRYTPTALERLATCPFKFFLRDHLGLAEPEAEDPLGTPDPRDLGSLVHEVLEELYARLVGEPAERWPEDEAAGPAGRGIASREARSPASRRTRIGFPVDVELRKARSAVARFVLLDKRRMASSGRVVVSVEEALEEALVLGGAELDVRGRVDRLDEDRDGALHVTDYKYSKGGSSPTPKKPLQGGRSLQLPLYALLVAARHGAERGTARIVHLKDGASRETYSTRIEDAAEGRDRLADLISRLAAFDAEGRFVQRLEDSICGHCDFEGLCGPSKVARARRKSTSPHRAALSSLAEDHP